MLNYTVHCWCLLLARVFRANATHHTTPMKMVLHMVKLYNYSIIPVVLFLLLQFVPDP